jgi:hypothetical protein
MAVINGTSRTGPLACHRLVGRQGTYFTFADYVRENADRNLNLKKKKKQAIF